ncbi:hypothetical protein ACRRTK_006140 [Alexandromys fortis]
MAFQSEQDDDKCVFSITVKLSSVFDLRSLCQDYIQQKTKCVSRGPQPRAVRLTSPRTEMPKRSQGSSASLQENLRIRILFHPEGSSILNAAIVRSFSIA